jgi:hypothetical protein
MTPTLIWALIIVTSILALGVWASIVFGLYLFMRFVKDEDKLMRELHAEPTPGIHVEHTGEDVSLKLWQIWHQMDENVAVFFRSGQKNAEIPVISEISFEAGYIYVEFDRHYENLTAVVVGKTMNQD